MNTNRQPPGRPTGGQFAAAEHSEAGLRLGPPPAVTAASLSAERDAVMAELERIEDAKTPLDREHQRLSARTAAAAVRELFPDAASYTLQPNEDGERQLDFYQVLDAEGNVLADAREDDEWAYSVVDGDNGPELGELTLCLDMKGYRWADGIADEVPWRQGDPWPRAMWKVDIDRALAAQDPACGDALLASRLLTAEEQSVLFDAARAGLEDLDDRLNERAMDYEEEDLERMREQRARLAALLGGS